mgnify:CR=1 FL=1
MAALSLAAVPALAQDTLSRIASSGELRLGHREKSLPFSYKDSASGKVQGYTVDICLQIFDEIMKTGRCMVLIGIEPGSSMVTTSVAATTWQRAWA